MDALWQDVRHGLRLLAKSKVFTTVAVLSLALGIGANTAFFSLIDALVLRELPVRQPERLVNLHTVSRSDGEQSLSFPLFQEIERHQRVFSGMFAWWGDAVSNVEIDGALSKNDIWAVTGNFYSELGVTPHTGRLLGPDDVKLNGGAPALVAVLGYGFWQRRLGGDSAAIGKTVRIEGVPFTIIGVTRKGFTGMDAFVEPEVTIPLTAEPLITGGELNSMYTSRTLWLDVTGRLKDGVSLAQASAELESLGPGVLAATLPPEYTPEKRQEYLSTHFKAASGATGAEWYLRGHFTRPLYALLGIAGLILLIACANLASLMLARAESRSQEMGIRVALGAGHWRLARQSLTESLLLSFGGTLLGSAFAFWGSRALANFVVVQIYIVPGSLDTSPDLRVLGFTAGVALLTGIFFGLAPAWRVTRGDPNEALQQSSRAPGRGTGRLGRALVVAQVTLSLVLLMGAGLFVRTLEGLRSANFGFQSEGVLDVSLFPKPGGYYNLDNDSYYRELVQRVSELPGIRSASLSHMSPAVGYEWEQPVSAQPARESGDTNAQFGMVAPRFFETLGMSLLEGRDFTWRDDDHSPRVAILGRSLARTLFPSADAVGQQVRMGTDPRQQNIEVVGVVSDASLADVRNRHPLEVFVPFLQGPYLQYSELLVRTTGDRGAAANLIRREIESVGHEYPSRISTLLDRIDRSILQERLTALLAAFLGALALLLVSIGSYGLMSYMVACRTREIGLRMALGAQRVAVLWMVLRQTLLLVLTGVGIGVPCALLATRLIANQLYGLSPGDPFTLAGAAFAMLLVGVLAGYLPAQRAARVDPMVALRHE